MISVDLNKILSDTGLKCTKQRLQVLDILENAPSPLSAENIYEKVSEMSLSTVYRTLEKLCEKNIISKHTIQDSDKLYYEIIRNSHRHYAICLGCQSMKYVDVCPVHTANIDNFTVTGHKLEIYGYCDKCRNSIK